MPESLTCSAGKGAFAFADSFTDLARFAKTANFLKFPLLRGKPDLSSLNSAAKAQYSAP